MSRDNGFAMAESADCQGHSRPFAAVVLQPRSVTAPSLAADLFDAAGTGNVVAARRALLLDPRTIHATDAEGRTALHHAAARNHPHCVLALLALGAEVDAVDDCGVTPLHLAATTNAREAAQILIARGARITCVAFRGSPPIRPECTTEIGS